MHCEIHGFKRCRIRPVESTKCSGNVRETLSPALYLRVMATVKVKLRTNKTNKRGRAPLVLQIVHNRRSTELSLNRYIEPKYWDARHEKVIGKHPSKSSINVHIKGKRRDCEGIIDDWVAQRKKFTLEDIVREYKGEGFEMDRSVVEYMEKYIEDNPEGLLPITMGNYRSTLSRLREFDPDATFEDITPRFLQKFEKYLKSKGNRVNTIHSRMKVLRKLMKLAVRQKIIPYDADPFLHYKLKWEPTRRRYLSEEDLRALEAHKEQTEGYQIVLDCFVFACYSGLRFSDLCQLTDDNVDELKEGHRLTLQMSKTKDIVSFRLPKRASEILIKYGFPKKGLLLPILDHNPEDLSKEVLTRRISSRNAYFNKIIKVIAKRAEVEARPSFHQARHTFATLSLAYGVRMEVVKELLGHSDLAATQIYARILGEAKNKAIDQWDRKS